MTVRTQHLDEETLTFRSADLSDGARNAVTVLGGKYVATSSTLQSRTVQSLEELLFPMTRDHFLQNYWGKAFAHIPGPKGKFVRLAPWQHLNRLLEEHRLRPPRLQLHQGGKELEAKRYLHMPDGHEPTLNATNFTNLLAQGASLVINEFDELYRPTRELMVALERIFRIHVQANLYAAWRKDNAFSLHYDEHDTIIAQVAGRKYWKVYEPTRLHPLDQGKDVEPAPEPTGAPIWDGVLEDGCLLHIPRGWWHVVYPLDEPTLHLTIGFRNPRGIDLLHWFAQQLRASVEVRKDLPHLAGPEECAIYVDSLYDQLRKGWTQDILDRYMAASDGRALPRPYLRLPEAATQDGLILEPKMQVQLVGPRELDLSARTEEGIFKFKCYGKKWQCDEALLPALRLLNDGQPHLFDELLIGTGRTDLAFALQSLLQALLLKDVITTRDTFIADQYGERK